MNYTTLRPYRYGNAHLLMCLTNERHINDYIRYFGEYSEAEVDVFRKFIKEDSVCMDLGAYFGELTIPMAELCPKGLVLAVEPQMVLCQILGGNLQLNSIPNVKTLEIAVGESSAITNMVSVQPHSYTVNWGLTKTLQSTDHPTVPIHSVDELELPGLDFIKIDVEGFEPNVLRGMKETIEQYKPVIYLEYEQNKSEIDEILNSHDYWYWRHFPPCVRMPNYLGNILTGQSPVSDMLLAVPAGRLVEKEWLEAQGFGIPLDYILPQPPPDYDPRKEIKQLHGE